MRVLAKMAKAILKVINDQEALGEERSSHGGGERQDLGNGSICLSDFNFHEEETEPSVDIFVQLATALRNTELVEVPTKGIEEIEEFAQEKSKIEINNITIDTLLEAIAKLQQENLELERGINSHVTFVNHKTKDDRKAEEQYSAVVFDCGTGETKCLLYKHENGKSCCEVSIKEVQKTDAIIDCIQNKSYLENVLIQFREGHSKSVELNGGKPIEYSIVGASSWARKDYDSVVINKEKGNLMLALVGEGLRPRILSQKEESYYELLACTYAFTTAQKAGMIAKDQSLAGVLSSGGGSCQFTYMFDLNISCILVELGNKEGLDRFVKSVKDEGKRGQEPLDVIDDWINDSKKMLQQQIHLKNYQPISGFLICTASQFYAAKSIESTTTTKFCNGDHEAKTVNKKDMVDMAKAFIEGMRQKWLAMTEEEIQALIDCKAKRHTFKDWAKSIANVSICCLTWECFLQDDAEICFKRDWSIDGAAFRNTWSAGWFLNLLRLQGIKTYHNQQHLNKIFHTMHQDEKKKYFLKKQFHLKYPKSARYLNDISLSLLSCMDEMTEKLALLAKRHAEKVDGWMKEIKAECGEHLSSSKEEVKLIGSECFDDLGKDYPDGVRFKSKSSTEQKIMCKLAELLRKKNNKKTDEHINSPTENDIVNEMKNGLRYTIALPVDSYFNAVKFIEKFLVDKECSIKAKNFWDKENNKTIFMGIIVRFFLPTDSFTEGCGYEKGRYPVELQIHTHESLELMVTHSRRVREEIRDGEVVMERKMKLVGECLEHCNKIEVPTMKTEEGEETSVADYEGNPLYKDKSQFKHRVPDWSKLGLTLSTYNRPDVVFFLLEHELQKVDDFGSDVNKIKMNGETLLITAARYGLTDFCKKLLEHKGAKVDATSNIGTTALMAAAEANDAETLGLLLDKNADVNTKNHRFESALDLARKNKENERVMTLLKDPKCDPSRWAISFEELLNVKKEAEKIFGNDFKGKTMREINTEIIMPTCAKYGTSYALSKNPKGLKTSVFVSHSWDEPFGAFVDSIQESFPNAFAKPNLWICAFSLFQGKYEDIKEQLDTDLSLSPFVKALKGADHYLVVRNENTDLLTRIWCICELKYAKQFDFIPDKTLISGPNKFKTLNTSCVDAESYNKEDKEKILKDLLNSGSIGEVDKIVHEFRCFLAHNDCSKYE